MEKNIIYLVLFTFWDQFPFFLFSLHFFSYFEHRCLCMKHWMAGAHNMVIQSLTFPDLCWCFLLQHFFANLEDKMDQKHFE